MCVGTRCSETSVIAGWARLWSCGWAAAASGAQELVGRTESAVASLGRFQFNATAHGQVDHHVVEGIAFAGELAQQPLLHRSG
jgi:hypothetical protein